MAILNPENYELWVDPGCKDYGALSEMQNPSSQRRRSVIP